MFKNARNLVTQLEIKEPNDFDTPNSEKYKHKNYVFVFIVILNICANLDQGFLPAATEEFKKDFGTDSSSLLGLYGSAVFLGYLMGNFK
jgi:hypothetical protein